MFSMELSSFDPDRHSSYLNTDACTFHRGSGWINRCVRIKSRWRYHPTWELTRASAFFVCFPSVEKHVIDLCRILQFISWPNRSLPSLIHNSNCSFRIRNIKQPKWKAFYLRESFHRIVFRRTNFQTINSQPKLSDGRLATISNIYIVETNEFNWGKFECKKRRKWVIFFSLRCNGCIGSVDKR